MLFRPLYNEKKEEKRIDSHIDPQLNKSLLILAKGRRSQSALEYMMTYGWAILIIVIVAVILYSMGIFNPSSSVTFTSTGFSPFKISSSLCTPLGIDFSIIAGPIPNGASSLNINKLFITSATGTNTSSVEYLLPYTISLTSGKSATILIPSISCTSVGTKYSLSTNLEYSYSTTAGNVITNATGTIAGTASSPIPTTFSAFGLPSGSAFTVNYGGVNKTSVASSNISFESMQSNVFKLYPVVYGGVTYYPIYSSGSNLPVDYNLEVDFISNSTPFYIADQGAENATVFYPYNFSLGRNITLTSSDYGSSGVSLMPNGEYAYVVEDNGINKTAVISTSTNQIVKNISMPEPCAITITPNGEYAYVSSCRNTNTVEVISTSTNQIIKTITVGDNPIGIAVTPNGNYVYVADQGSNKTSVISTSTNTIIKNISGFYYPTGIAIAPNGLVYVSNSGNGSVSIINSLNNKLIGNIATPYSSSPRGLAITRNGKYLYVTNGNTKGVSVVSLSTNSVVATIPIPYTKQFAFSPNGKYLFSTTPYAYPYQMEVIYLINNSYKNITAGKGYYNICPINNAPTGNGAEC